MIWLFLIGLLSGIISGMGIGGGAILIPALGMLFDLKQQSAQQVNLIYFIPTAIIAIITHLKEGNIQKDVAGKIIVYGLIGAVAGAFIAVKMDADLLKKIFGGFLLLLGIYEFRKGRASASTDKAPTQTKE